MWVLSPNCQPSLTSENQSLQKMVCNENSDRLFKVMELKGVPLVAYCILHNYCLRNGLFFMPKMQVLVCRVKNAFLLGTIWRLDIV